MAVGLELLVLLIAFTWAGASYSPYTCSHTGVLDLIDAALGDNKHLPNGVQIIYDQEQDTHAYKLRSKASRLGIPVEKVLPGCDYWPEEYSLLVTLKVSDQYKSSEYIFSLLREKLRAIRLGLRIAPGIILFEYTDHKKRHKRLTTFTDMSLFDFGWHTLIITVTADKISYAIDCGSQRSKTVKRAFPAMLDISKNWLQIGNKNRTRDRFTGALKNLVLFPGADAYSKVCPSKNARIPDITWLKSVTDIAEDDPSKYIQDEENIIPQALSQKTDRFHYSTGKHSVCNADETGKVMVDTDEHFIRVCDSGEWKPFVFRQDRRKEMDYIEDYQMIDTPGACTDVEIFSIHGEGTFMVLACESKKQVGGMQISPIYKWSNGKFYTYQNLTTSRSQSWKFFTIDVEIYLAVANKGTGTQLKGICTIYKWSSEHRLFFKHQDIITYTARDVEHFYDNGDDYLAIANYAKDGHLQMASVIYMWDRKRSVFHPVQTVISSGAMDWTYFSVDGTGYLALANSFDGMTTKVNSAIYRLNLGRLTEVQRIETLGAVDWEYFTINDDVFLAVANSRNYGPQNRQGIAPYYVNSAIYKFDKVNKKFEKYQDIPTKSATDWESFRVGDSTYLIVSDAQRDGDAKLFPGRSAVYRWQGLEKFVRVHVLETLACEDWEFFEAGERPYLVYTNSQSQTVNILRIKLK